MQIDGYARYLEEKNLTLDKIDQAVAIVQQLSNFLSKSDKTVETSNKEDFYKFSYELIRNKENSVDNFEGLLRYGYFKDNKDLIVTCMEILDGREMIENFSALLISKFGQILHDDVFQDTKIPSLGHNKNIIIFFRPQ